VRAVHPGRFKYAANRDESKAPGFAELQGISREHAISPVGITTYVNTASLILDKTVASSLIKWGRFPVFSSCSITPTTMSSLMPSVSTLPSAAGPGEGGGVFSKAALPLLFGLSANETAFGCVEGVDDDGRAGEVGEDEIEGCDRFIFFAGGDGCDSVAGAGLDTGGR